MRKLLLLILLLTSGHAYAQQTSRTAISSGGAYAENGGYSLSMSYGQLATITLNGSTAELNQGFQQADFNRCLGDFNFDGVINTADLLFLLAENGCIEDCLADMNNDGLVNTGDLTALLTLFGTNCP